MTVSHRLSVAAVITLALVAAGRTEPKAEPVPIKFRPGASQATVSGTLANNVQAEYVFTARKGQKAVLSIASSPKGKYHAFGVLGRGFDFASRYDNNYQWAGPLPEDGEYLVTVITRYTDRVKKARYTLTLTLK